MNRNHGMLGLLIFVLGVAVGWVSRGIPQMETDGPSKQTSASVPAKVSSGSPSGNDTPAPSPVPGKRAIRETTPKKEKNVVFDPDSKEAKEMQDRVGKMMANRKRTSLEQRIQKLAESLNLTEDQKSKLTAWVDERVGKLESSNLMDPTASAEAMKAASEAGLDEKLAENLTEDQKAAFAGFKEREKQAKIDSMALKSLSQLQGVIDFEEGQRDEVYKILSQFAEERLQKSASSPLSEMSMMGDFGVDIDPYGLGIQEAMQEAFKPEEMEKNPQAWRTGMQGIIDKCINDKVEKLRPVLNDKQLEQYRAELKNKGAGMFGGALLGDEDSHDTTIVIPAN